MKKKVLLLGLGNFGRSWANSVLPKCAEFAEFVGAVDRNVETHKKAPEGVRLFTDLDEAIAETSPDLVVNVTPPDAHTAINKKLVDLGIPVLCEKPISGGLEDAKDLLAYLQTKDGFVMIGENYRYSATLRRAREVLDEVDLGALHLIEGHFRHYHADYSAFYHGHLAHPLLTDVTIHHLDVARYLSGQEPRTVSCREWGAPYTWYDYRPATASILTEMTNGVVCHYFGTLASPVTTTTWNGDWELEFDRGTFRLQNDKITVTTKEGTVEYAKDARYPSDGRITMLREALTAIEEGRAGETDIHDNYKSFAWMQAAVISSEKGETVEIEKL